MGVQRVSVRDLVWQAVVAAMADDWRCLRGDGDEPLSAEWTPDECHPVGVSWVDLVFGERTFRVSVRELRGGRARRSRPTPPLPPAGG